MSEFRFDIVESLSTLYQLSLSIGNSFDIEESTESFLQALMQQQNLYYSGYFTFSSKQQIEGIRTIPFMKKNSFEISESFSDFIKNNDKKTINQGDLFYKDVRVLSHEEYSNYCIYFSGTKNIIVLGRKNRPFSTTEILKNNIIMNKFGLFMESLESHHQIKKEIKIKEQYAKTIEENNQLLVKQNEELLKYISSNNELEKFAYRTSHDLKAPLRAIMGFSQILKKAFNDGITEKHLKYLDTIVEAGIQMNSLIDGILEYSKVNATIVKYESIDFQNLISKTCKMLNKDLADPNCEIEIKEIPDTVIADKTKLQQVILNLLNNALKFTKNEISPKVIIACKEDDSKYLFTIEDNGIGIKEEHTNVIFEEFEKLNPNSSFAGSGIGLSTCKSIVIQHGGEIWVESEIGIGSTFYFTIKKTTYNTA